MRRFVSLLNYGILFKIISNLMTAYMLNLCWSHGQNNMYVGVQVVHTFAKCHIKIKLEKVHTYYTLENLLSNMYYVPTNCKKKVYTIEIGLPIGTKH